MAKTSISDVFSGVPFSDQVSEIARNKNALIASGAVVPSATIGGLINSGGLTFNIPFLHSTAINGAASAVSTDDATALTPQAVLGNAQAGTKLSRNQSWSAYNLVASSNGANVLDYAASQVAEYWAAQDNAVVQAILTGVEADSVANHASDLVNNQTTVSITRNMIIDTAYTFSTAIEGLILIMHPLVAAALKKEDALLWGFQGQNGNVLGFETYMGMRVMVDASMTQGVPAVGDYKTYILKAGAFGFGEANLGEVGARLEKSEAVGNGRGSETLYSSRDYVIHPDGFSWTGSTQAGSTPSNAELATSGNYVRVYNDRRNIGVAALYSAL